MRKIINLLIVLLVLGVFVSGCTTPEVDLSRKGPSGQAGRSNIAHLYLYEKDPATWSIIEYGAWGKMKYSLSGEEFDFVFNGHDLEPGLDYTLIYYPDPWPGEGLICLGDGVVNDEGDVHIAESVEIDFLPIVLDENFPDGAKIWLVLSDDVDCDGKKMIGWTPTEYLFEDDLIQFNEGEQYISDEFTFSANDNSDPSGTGNEDYFDTENNILTTDGNPATDYYLHISGGPEIKDDIFGLYLVEYVGEGDLVSYYSTKPSTPIDWQGYLLDAADGVNPFAYIKGGSGTPLLLDAAKFDLIVVEEAMTIPGDYPEGTYTVAGKVETDDSWKAVIFELTIEWEE